MFHTQCKKTDDSEKKEWNETLMQLITIGVCKIKGGGFPWGLFVLELRPSKSE